MEGIKDNIKWSKQHSLGEKSVGMNGEDGIPAAHISQRVPGSARIWFRLGLA